MMQLNKHALMFFSRSPTVSVSPQKTHFEGKANNEIAQTTQVEYITDEDWTTLVKHWSDPKYQVGYMYLIRSHIELVITYVPYKCILFQANYLKNKTTTLK